PPAHPCVRNDCQGGPGGPCGPCSAHPLPHPQVKPQLEEKENRKYPVFEAVSYKTQVVAGINYFIKVHIGDENFLHLRVFQGLAHENKAAVLVAYQTNKSRQDELEYF
ncbi:cystatin-B, partial [Fukomys damarensis]|uniref:cystatin-B n=1 Tax=Fukomys damarensis TaxID=885580 RepID=UPI00145544AD